MRAIDRLYKREETITRSVHIDEDLYEKVQYLSENVYEASASKIINVCIENALLKNKDKTGISFSRLINGVIKELLEDYKNEF